ncbi:MAG: hypothetical protein IKE23_12760, partial [Exiguobacterium sp.]|nr:hypothetical protein [Exiguobacterium sp.]
MNTIIKRTWNQNRMSNIEDLRGMAFQAEDGGHTFEISGINDANEAVSLSGTVAGVFMRPDGTDVALTGTASAGVVSVTLSDACYAVDGRFGLYIFVTSDSRKTCIYACIGTVAQTSYGTVAGDTPADVVDLVNAINAAIASIPADYSALLDSIAPSFSDSTAYTTGTIVWYNGLLYQFTADKAAGSWDATKVRQIALADDVSELKNAFVESNGLEEISGLVVTQGIILLPDGTEGPSSDYETSNYIEVNEGELYLVTNSTGGSPDRANGRSNLTGVFGYDTNKNAVLLLEDQLSGTQQIDGRHIAKDYIVKIPSGIKYIRATSAYKTSVQSYQSSPLILHKITNNGYNGVDYSAEYVMPSIVNGTQENPDNAYAVCTEFIPVFVGANVSCNVIKPYRTNTNYYSYGFATYDADKNMVRNFYYNGNSYDKSSVKIENGECYIKFSVCEYNSDKNAVANRVTDYENYPINVYISGERTVLEYIDGLNDALAKSNARILNLEIDSAPVDVEFDKITGKNIDFYTGEEVAGADYDSTDFIPVVPREHYIYTGVLGANYYSSIVAGGAYYDSNKAYLCGAISQMSAIGASGSRHIINGYRFEIPSGVAYMRVSSAARNSASNTYPKSDIIL